MKGGNVAPWFRVFEKQNGHDTGRWQWGQEENNETFVYPGYWMFGDAICPPPGVGLCKVDKLEKVTQP